MRSRGAVLEIQIIDVERDVISNIARVSTLMDEIARQSDRIAKFEAVGLSALVAEALVYPANNLTHLAIDGRGSEKLPLIFGGQLPRLRHLSLSNPSGWSLRGFPNVTKAIISGDNRRISNQCLANFLDGANNLEKLHMSRLRGSRADSQHAARPPIFLPSLRKLRVAFCGSSGILSQLNLPASVRASIVSDYEPNNRHMLQYLPAAVTFMPLHGAQILIVALNPTDSGSYLITHRSGRSSCFLEVYDEHRRVDQGWVLLTVNAITEFKPFHLIESLILSVEQCSIPWRKWFPWLVRVVNVDVCSVDIEELVLELSRVHPDRDGPVCPSLQYLSLERKGCGPALDSSVLRSCLLARSQVRHPVTWLRVRDRDWTAVDQLDLGWRALITSQGKSLCIADGLDAERHVRHTQKRSTASQPP